MTARGIKTKTGGKEGRRRGVKDGKEREGGRSWGDGEKTTSVTESARICLLAVFQTRSTGNKETV